MESGVTFARMDLEHDERFQRLRAELGVSAFGLNLLLLRPGQRSRIHRHMHQEEVYVVLQGTLTLYVEGEPHELVHGELARVAPEGATPARQPASERPGDPRGRRLGRPRGPRRARLHLLGGDRRRPSAPGVPLPQDLLV